MNTVALVLVLVRSLSVSVDTQAGGWAVLQRDYFACGAVIEVIPVRNGEAMVRGFGLFWRTSGLEPCCFECTAVRGGLVAVTIEGVLSGDLYPLMEQAGPGGVIIEESPRGSGPSLLVSNWRSLTL